MKSKSPCVLVGATTDGEKVDLNVLFSLVHEKTMVLSHIDKHTLSHTQTHSHCSLCCKLTYTLILSKLSYDKGIVRLLVWLPQMGFPDLRDDVIGFFERLKHLSNLGPLLCRVL